MPVILKNNALSTLATGATASDTGIVVVDGSQFPAITAGEYFYATLVSQAGTTEIIKVTARVGNSMTVVRAQDGSTAATFQAGALVEMRVNVASIADLRDEAVEISIADAGGYYTAGTVESALQEAALVTLSRLDVATLLADTALTYSNAPQNTIVRTRAEGFAYKVAASGATNQHVTTAGGVKLYVQQTGTGYNVKAFGASGGGVADDTSAINAAITALTSSSALIFPSGVYVYNGGVNGMQVTGLTNVEIVADGAQITFGLNARFMTILNCTGIKVHGFKLKGTFSNAQRYVGNEEQGRIVNQSSSDIEIFGNRWEDVAAALFCQVGSDNVKFHHNTCIRTHAGIQTSSAVYSNLFITDNYFLGHIYQTIDVGSDDQIAVFGNAAGKVVIARNIIDKQGPTPYNQARAINIDVGSGSNSEIIVNENIVKNVITTTGTAARAAILFSGQNASSAVARSVVCNNIIDNCNSPIAINIYVSNLLVSGNNIKGAVTISGLSTSGIGISVNAGGLDAELVVSQNSVSLCNIHGIDIASANRVVVSSNMLRGNTSRGISLDSANDAIISGNLCLSNNDGIFINNTQRVSVSGNTSSSNSRYGLRVQGSTISGAITGNVLKNNTTSDFSDAATTKDYVLNANYGAGTRAISGTATVGANLRGSGVFSASTTATVSLPTPESDANYFIALGPTSNNSFWVTNKTVNGFTLNCSASVSTAIDWVMVR